MAEPTAYPYKYDLHEAKNGALVYMDVNASGMCGYVVVKSISVMALALYSRQIHIHIRMISIRPRIVAYGYII